MISRVFWIFCALWCLIQISISGAVHAATPAFELISNQASAIYFDDARRVGALSLSNIAMVRVSATAAHTLQADRTVEASMGQHLSLNHLLTNTGNISDEYDVSIVQGTGDFTLASLALHHDINGNGVIEPGEPALARTAILAPGQSIALVIVGQIPASASVGQQASVTITATSVTTPANQVSNVDTLQLVVDEFLLFYKTTEPTCRTPIDPGGTISYTLRFSNVGTQSLEERTIVVDSTPKDGILIEDTIQPNTYLFKPQTLITAPFTAEPLVKLYDPLYGDDEGWISWDNWNGTDLVEKIGLLVPAINLASEQSGRFDFSVKLIEAITLGTSLVNTAHIYMDGSSSPKFSTNQVCNIITPIDLAAPLEINNAVIRFLEPEESLRASQTEPDFENDAHYQDAQIYRLDNFEGYTSIRDGIYLEVRSTSVNTSPLTPETILVHLESDLTGDYIDVTLQETGPNTGKFRSLVPVSLSETLSGSGATCSVDSISSCVLNSIANDHLYASFLDPGMGVVISDISVVDPLGVIFDSGGLQPVAGAQVTIIDQNGDPALDPDTGGTTSLEPQLTEEDGAYQFPRVYPGTYFVQVVPPPNYQLQPSSIPPDDFIGIRKVGPYSYGRDGFYGITDSGLFTLNAGDPALVVDVPLDAMPSGSHLSIEKTASVKRAQVGDYIPYEVKISNSSNLLLVNSVLIDRLPYGFKYIKGSTRVDGELSSDPTGGSGPDLSFNVGRIAMDTEVTVNYTLQITPAAVDGDGINTAQVLSETYTGYPFNSEVSRMQVIVDKEGLFSERGILFGKIFFNRECSQEEEKTEFPIGAVRLYMEDGTWVITDENGQYSLYGFKSGLHVIKIDPTTLPKGVNLVVMDSRQGDDPESRFIDLVNGEMYRADFEASCLMQDSEAVMKEISERNQSINSDWQLDEALRFEGTLANNQINSSQIDSGGASDDGDISGGVIYPAGASKLPTFTTPRPDKIAVEHTPAVEMAEAPDPQKVVTTLTNAMGQQGVWLWPTSEISRDGRFMVVVPIGTNPDLLVNGETVAASQLGEQIANRQEQVQVLAWYGVTLQPGENQLEVVGRDPFGNVRELADRKVMQPGGIAHLKLLPEVDQLDADGGRSVLPLKIVLIDQQELPMSGVHFVTVESSSGNWVEEDIQKSEPGWQVKVINGEALVHLRSSDKAGKVTVKASMGQRYSSQTKVTFMAPMRPLLAAGLVDLSISLNDLVSNGLAPPIQTDNFDEEINLKGRTALFLKGKIRGNLLLTLSYDSDKDTGEHLLRDIDPDAYYPIYGDASVKGYDAQSRSKLYVRLERGKNSLMWGDFITDNQAEESLGRWQRTLTGVNARFETDRFDVTAFGARPENQRITEEFRGNGTATFYRINNAPIERNSEIIERITRDRENHGLVIERVPLRHLSDYSIDYLNGYITFQQVIPSQDESGNPIFIQVTYDAEEKGNEYTVAGLRLGYEVSEQVTIGGGYSFDGHPDDGRQLGSVFIDYTPTEKHRIILEGAVMEHEDDTPSGVAERLIIESQLSEQLKMKLSHSSAEEGFTNSNAPVSSGRREAKVEMEYSLQPGTDLTLEGLQSEDLTSDDKRRSLSLAATHQFGNWRTTTGIRHVDQQNTEEENSFNTARLRLERAYTLFNREGQVYGEWEQAVEDTDKKDIKVGADYQIHPLTKLYARHEIINSLSGITSLSSAVEQSTTVIGASSTALSMTESYNEYRIRGGINGYESESATGIKKTIELEPGLTLDPQLEYIHTFEGENMGDAFSISLGLSDTRSPDSKTSLRVETRRGNSSDYYGLTGRYAARLSRDWTGMVKEDFSMELPVDSDNQIRHRFTLGAARRPKDDSRWHFLGLYQWIDEQQQSDYSSRGVHLISTHHNYKLSDKLTLTGRLASKWQDIEIDTDNYSSTVQLLGGGFVWGINKRLNLDIHGGILSTDLGNSSRYSGGLGINYLVKKNMRVGIGYNFTGFSDRDLDQEEYFGQGLKLWFQLKFDEDLFSFLKEPNG